MWVDQVCCWFSPLLREDFLRVSPVFPSPQNPGFSNSSSTRNQVDEEPHLMDMLPLNRSYYLYIQITPSSEVKETEFGYTS